MSLGDPRPVFGLSKERDGLRVLATSARVAFRRLAVKVGRKLQHVRIRGIPRILYWTGPILVEPGAKVLESISGIRLALDIRDYFSCMMFYARYESEVVHLFGLLVKEGDSAVLQMYNAEIVGVDMPVEATADLPCDGPMLEAGWRHASQLSFHELVTPAVPWHPQEVLGGYEPEWGGDGHKFMLAR